MKIYALIILIILSLFFITYFNIPLTIIFESSLIKLPSGILPLGKLEDNEEINILIGLKLRNQDFLESLIAKGINLPLDENFLNNFLPTNEDYQKILDFIKKANPEEITTYKNRLIVAFKAKARDVEQLLNVKFYKFFYNNSIYYYSSAPIINCEIANYISGFAGLENLTRYKNSLYFQISTTLFTPQEIRQIYEIDKLLNKGYNGTGQTIVIGSVGSFNQADIDKFTSMFNLPNQPIEVHKVLGYTSGIEGETTIDIEWARAIAPAAKIILVTIPDSSFTSFTQLFNYIVSNDLGRIVSTSWIIEEDLLSKDEINIQHSIFLLGLAKGINFFFPSGDWGSSNTPRPLFVSSINRTISYYPASDPFVTSVGGTTLIKKTFGFYEEAWGGIDNGLTYGSGGGFSKFFTRPFYQPNQIGKMRGYPDVSLNAASSSPYAIIFNGKLGAGYGTSISTPIWAAITAILSQMSKGNIGFLNYRLYKIYNSTIYSEVFNDITEGTNGYYNATKGWDPVTGLGSPKTFELLNYLKTNSKSIYIIPTTDISIKIKINDSIESIPKIINFTDKINLKIDLNDTIYISKDIRYKYLKTYGVINSNKTSFNLTLNENSNIIVVYNKQYFINATTNFGYVVGAGWQNEGDYITLRAINPFYIFFTFKGWKGDINSSSPVLNIKVDRSYNLYAEWQFSIIGLIFFISILVALIIGIILIFRESRRLTKKATQVDQGLGSFGYS
jgi:subtilase family serine protease